MRYFKTSTDQQPVVLSSRKMYVFTKRYILLAVFYLIGLMAGNAQDIHFSQFFEAPLIRNPSLSGIFPGDVRAQAVYRRQWASVADPFNTVSVNAEFKNPIGKKSDFLTLGLQILNDRAGAASYTMTSVLPAVNYHKSLNPDKNRYLSLGVMGGYVQHSIDRSKITTGSQFDGSDYNPSLPDGETFLNGNYNYWDASIGLTYSSSFGSDPINNYFIGAAFHHLNKPKNSFYKDPSIELQSNIVLSAGVKMAVNDFSYCTFQGDYTMQGNARELIAGFLYAFKFGTNLNEPLYTLHFGGFIRYDDAIIPVVKLDYRPFSIGISYDVNISSLKTASNGRGGTELSLAYVGFLDRSSSTRNAVACPRF